MKRPFIDSHVHFWDPQHLGYEWLAEVPRIHSPFLLGDLVRHAGDLSLEEVVFVQADCIPEDAMLEVEWVTALAREEPWIRGIVAFAPLEEGVAVRGWL
ncbi:MAG: hypothetical protein M3220_19725 [Chloroflexota bacterium]|nr:hypothetical protein [Chloroflexota bacterium]